LEGEIMTTRVSAVEARRQLGRLLNVVSITNEDVVIERAGKEIARLTRVDSVGETIASGKLDFRKARGLGRDLWRGVDAEQYVNRERAEWD